MICSTGLDNSTITGDYTIGIKSEWLFLVGDVFGRYISGISGDYLFHSVPYYSMSEEDLELEEFNKLGEQASQGCVRLAVSDAKWVYDNCPTGTNVSIYDDAENAGLSENRMQSKLPISPTNGIRQTAIKMPVCQSNTNNQRCKRLHNQKRRRILRPCRSNSR